MATEQPESELKRLRKEQHKARRDEVFGGLSPAEQAAYDGKAARIHQLQSDFKAEQSRQTRDSETDTPQC